ncbi:MAG TPA: carboxylate--amine ligase [Thermodesulfobacteriota bacterium]|nr:carboxylate--amine ligase [Thermodesulfobacteriota bacterium]
MKRILITGAGGTPSTNFVRSLREAPEPFYIIGVDCNKYYLQRAETDEKYLIPEAGESDYIPVLRSIIEDTGAQLVYSQPDPEIYLISLHRDELGALTFLPDHRTIEVCQNKFDSFLKWKQAGLKVPETIMVETERDLECAFEEFGTPIWLRAIVSPGGGKGSFRAKNLRVARAWLDFCEGWGNFTAAKCLQPDSITWSSLWNQGELVVAQGRKRLYWEFGNRAPSGVTGITGTGITVSDQALDKIALRAIVAIASCPNGIFSVDLTYDEDGIPNPTEINIGRFFTTHLFFTRAGVNMPYLFVKLAFDEPLPTLPCKINPLTPNLAWIRGMDFLPILTEVRQIEQSVEELEARRHRLDLQNCV